MVYLRRQPTTGPGILRFEPESGLALEAQRHRQPDLRQVFAAGDYESPAVIRGTDGHAQPLTLFGCTVTHSNASAALDQFQIGSLHALIGAHYNQFADATFQTATASYSLLDAWLRRCALEQITGPNGLPAFTQHAPADISVTLPNGAQITITMSLSQENRLISLTLSQAQFVRFTLPTSLGIQALASDYLYPFARLLSFLAGFEVSIDGVQFPQAPPLPHIEWLHGNRGITTVKRELHAHEALVPCGTVVGTLPALIIRWFAYRSEMESILNLYFTAAHNLEIPENTRFLLLAQALEAYHSRRDRFVNEIQPTAVFQARREALVAAVPPAEQDWLRDKLNFANQKTLAQRLNELIADQQTSAAQFIPDTTLFANTIRWTRNYYTHFPEDEEERIARGRGRIAQGADLSRVDSIQMQALLELLFIADLGIPPAAIRNVVARAQGRRVITA